MRLRLIFLRDIIQGVDVSHNCRWDCKQVWWVNRGFVWWERSGWKRVMMITSGTWVAWESTSRPTPTSIFEKRVIQLISYFSSHSLTSAGRFIWSPSLGHRIITAFVPVSSKAAIVTNGFGTIATDLFGSTYAEAVWTPISSKEGQIIHHCRQAT